MTRIGTVVLALGACWSVAALAQSGPWERLEHEGVTYAGTIDERKNSLSMFCAEGGRATLVLTSPAFHVSVPDDHSYSLIFVTARERVEMVATSKDAEMIYEAADLNARVALERLVEDIGASQSFTVAISPLNWRQDFSAEGAAQALAGLLDKC